MKKVLLILFITLFNTSLFAEINEPGSGIINYWHDFEKYYKEELKKSQKKKQKLIIYGSTSTRGWATGTSITKEINDKSHKKAYKRCMKTAKKYTQKDCYLFAIDDEVVWNFDAVVVKKTIYNTDLSELPIGDRALAIVLEEDKKPGRFFEDQPDVNDDFQIHFIYFLAKNTKDKERDLNGWIEKEVKKIDDTFFKMTGDKQRLKFDYREDGKLDISFARMDRKAKKGGWNVNYPEYYLQKQGFNNPKKLYFSFTDAASGDGGQMGPHHGYLFIGRASGQITKISIHELLHGNGFAMPCTTGVRDGTHLGVGILSQQLSLKFGKAVYEHNDPTCPDLKDSVYLTPTSDDPFDPLQIACALGQKKRNNPPGNYEIPARYTHKKLLKGRKNEWCTYKLTEYAKEDWFKSWKK